MDWEDYQQTTARLSAFLYLFAGLIALVALFLPGIRENTAFVPAIFLILLAPPAAYLTYNIPWPRLHHDAFLAVCFAACAHLAAFLSVTGGSDSPFWALVMFIAISSAAYYRQDLSVYVALALAIGVLLSPAVYEPAELSVIGVRIFITVIVFVVGRWLFKSMAQSFLRLYEKEQDRRSLAAQAAIGSLLLSEPSVESAAPRVLEAIGKHFDFSEGALWLVSEGRLWHAASWPRGTDGSAGGQEGLSPHDPSMLVTVWKTGAPVWATDAGEEQHVLGGAPGNPQSRVCFPIRSAYGIAGVVAMLSAGPQERGDTVEQSLTVIGDALGQFLDRKEIEHRLRESERQRSEFRGMVNHELRSPLAVIKGSVALAKDSVSAGDTSELTGFLDGIDHQAERVLALVNNLLDVSQMEAGAFRVSPEPGHLREALQEALATLARTSPVRVAARIPEDLPPVNLDRQRVVQVVENLLSNAARFASADTEVELAVERNGTEVLTRVTNMGPAIPADKMGQLFQKFSQLHTETIATAGRGLGLAICKGIVEAHGGHIWAQSSEERGETTFSFTLPVAGGLASGGNGQ